MVLKLTPEQVKERHAQLDGGIARQEPTSIAMGFIRSLNQDNGCNYGFSTRQVELLAQHVQAALAQFKPNGEGQVLFSEKLIDDIACGVDPESYKEICEIIGDIFQGMDENGNDLPQPKQPFHFDSYPFTLFVVPSNSTF